ncbi:hypothetical protein JM93_00077 [Roseibium hamelinense]|uniref:ABC-type amino acid transport substrate-binding protein n=1 Tax=Roseibium hamelinense TaxID=150831 RepID=A0A562TG87_9HYPH|nr:hypothetical protein [Roseibium hamelinense]MTI43118.1 hypothetical protein [Roseibium hamelinense]TWI92535.1 hypothetical protein JM93_00077 [Roseibium hamelinense]
MNRLLLGLLAVFASVSGCLAEVFRLGIVGEDESRYDYEIGLIELALQKAEGDHTLEIVAHPNSSQSRVLLMLMNDVADFDVTFSGIDRERHARLLTVPVPLQRGLLGLRILIVSERHKDRLAGVETLEDLKKVPIGSGTGWPDTSILENAGFSVAQSDYESLFKMVYKGRIAGYARGVAEPYREVAVRAADMPGLAIDTRLLLAYPFDTFFFVGKQDKKRHDILLQGLTRAYEDGSFMTYFEGHPRIRSVFLQADLDRRVRFDIENPFLPEAFQNIPDKYWHR